jgi:leader peptidase (prepilin peptidase)/N-methyltransferase
LQYSIEILIPYLFIIAGLIFGSFFNVLIYRIPEKKSIINPPSSCPACGAPIRFYDNIPIVSYIILLGRCRHCKERISIRYPLVEALTALLFWFCYYKFDLTYQVIPAIFLCSICVTVAFIDLDRLIIPDVITLPGMILGIGFSFLPAGLNVKESIIGFLAGGIILYGIAVLGNVVFKRESMGGGDIKLIALIGAFLGWENAVLTIIIGSFAGTLVGIIVMSRPRRDDSHMIPYGPFLALGALISLFWGNDLINMYLSYLGR